MSCPRRLFHSAITPRPSIGHITWRDVERTRVTDFAAFALAASKSTSMYVVRKRLSPQGSWTSGAPGLRAACMSATTGSASKSTSICAAMSSASARVGAAQSAISSPAKRTLPVASGGCTDDLKPGSEVSARIGFTPARSSAMSTRSRKCGRNGEAFDARMRQGAAQKRHLQHAGHLDVADVLAATAHVAVVLLARHARTDALSGHPANPIAHARSSPISSMLRRTQSPG